MASDLKQTTDQHWASYLPESPLEAGRWGRESISTHANPEYWAMIWGYSVSQVVAAKAAACAAKLARLEGKISYAK